MIDHKRLRELIKLMVTNDLTEIDLQGEGERVTLKRGGVVAAPVVTHPSPAAGQPLPVQAAVPAAEDADKIDKPAIRSPMVGSFYAAPSPDAGPFVKVGDTVESDTQVGIIEAMKVFNEIKAEVSGVIEQILVENGEAVEFDQPLFVIRPQ